MEKESNTITSEVSSDMELVQENKATIVELQSPTSPNKIDTCTPNAQQKRLMSETSSSKSTTSPPARHQQQQKSLIQSQKK